MWINHFKRHNMPVFGIWFFSLPLLVFGQSMQEFSLPYQLDAPIRQLTVSRQLDEISGLSLDLEAENLIAIQDEEGILFYLDKETGETTDKISFWKEGDYEGVEVVGESVFVVKSTGTLYHVENVGETNQSVIKYNDFLTSENNIEGLTYWPKGNKLLLACKAQPGKNLDGTREKAIYAFDLENNRFEPDPLMVIERSTIGQYLGQCHPGPNHLKICGYFDVSKDDFEFNPTAVAIHPLTDELYILSSKGNLLFVISMEGEVRHIAKLPKSLHRQPEGICFDHEGNMYISNERKKDQEANVILYEIVK